MNLFRVGPYKCLALLGSQREVRKEAITAHSATFTQRPPVSCL